MQRAEVSYARRRKQIPSTVERPRNTEVEGGAPEKQMTTDHRGNSTQEDSHCQKCT